MQWLIIVLLLGVSALQAKEAKLRVGTFNVHDYFCKDRVVDGIFFKNYAKPQHEVRAVRKTIHAVNPDILILQEIQEKFLEDLQRALKQEDLDYPYAYTLLGPDSERCLAALSKVKPKAVVQHRKIPFTYKGKACTVKRGLLELVFEDTQGTQWTLYGVHLKSKIHKSKKERKKDPDCEGFRSAEARALRRTILGPREDSKEEDPRHPQRFLIVGDFNDHPRSACVEHLQSFSQKKQKRILSQRLPLKEIQTPLVPTWTLYSEYSASWHTVDHILVSPGLKPQLAQAYAQLSEPNTGSDHRLVYVDLRKE